MAVESADSEKQLGRWRGARELSHPNLIRVYEAGRCELDGKELLYVVEEYAEENLSQILPERALTAEETQAMLPPILSALRFVHDKRFVHGSIQPSNILAIGDKVKLSSDTLSALGERSRGARKPSAYDPPETHEQASTAADVWQLGMTLVEVLTQRLPAWDRAGSTSPEVPATVPAAFREIAGHCLQRDATQRWTAAKILDRVQAGQAEKGRQRSATVAPKGPVPAANVAAARGGRIASSSSAAIPDRQNKSAKWLYFLALAAIVVIVFFLIARPKSPSPQAKLKSTQAQTDAKSEGAHSAEPEAKEPAKTGGDEKASGRAAAGTEAENGVLREVMPQVAPSARRTIQGTIKVRVKISVDAAGNVESANLESAGPSKYFSRVALEAARGWKFSPAPTGASGSREWKLQFAFSRSKTEASVVRGKR